MANAPAGHISLHGSNITMAAPWLPRGSLSTHLSLALAKLLARIWLGSHPLSHLGVSLPKTQNARVCEHPGATHMQRKPPLRRLGQSGLSLLSVHLGPGGLKGKRTGGWETRVPQPRTRPHRKRFTLRTHQEFTSLGQPSGHCPLVHAT